MTRSPTHPLRGWNHALAVIAHPDDESFGMGAVLATLVAEHCRVSVLCFTRGEASTLGAAADLGAIRSEELRAAADELGLSAVHLLGYPDGELSTIDTEVLVDHINTHLDGVDLLVAFERGGVTGHPDHIAATTAAIAVANDRGMALVEWGVSETVASTLQAEFGAPFTVIDPNGSQTIGVDRTPQLRAILRHTSQATDNPILARRLTLQGNHETIRITSAH